MDAGVGIVTATLEDVERLVPLFDAYRQFYRKPPDSELAGRFLRERLGQGESTILIAERAGSALGFAQLYPSFSSGAAARIWILNDLFVVPEARRAGVGKSLIETSLAHAKQTGAVRVTLSTEHTNHGARALYEAMGFRPDTSFAVYHFAF